MSSAAYAFFRQAIEAKKQVHCVFGGLKRELCPILLGYTKGRERTLSYQVGGKSSSGPLRAGERWRCFWLSELTDISLQDGPCPDPAGLAAHSQSQRCVEDVRFDVNPSSPYVKPPRRKS